MTKRGLTLVNAMHIAASVFINDDAGLWAGCTTALVRTPVQGGQGRRRAPEAGSRNRLHFKFHGPRRAAVVAVTNGRLDFDTWERILQGQAEWLARES
jgi:thiamine phosphate synthase YjbQ (UPF0047 family)